MWLFRILLAAMFLGLTVYTAIVIANHGANLVPIFFGDMAKFAWPGQFNADFMGFLILSALWTAWRLTFSVQGLALSVLALFGGILFLSAYLLILSFATRGSIVTILVGPSRAAT